MPPAPFRHAAQQVHDAQHFGPICPQRLPVQLASGQLELLGRLAETLEEFKTNSRPRTNLGARLQLDLMQNLLPAHQFDRQRATLEQLSRLESAEDCLNLNIFVPEEGECCARGSGGQVV